MLTCLLKYSYVAVVFKMFYKNVSNPNFIPRIENPKIWDHCTKRSELRCGHTRLILDLLDQREAGGISLMHH